MNTMGYTRPIRVDARQLRRTVSCRQLVSLLRGRIQCTINRENCLPRQGHLGSQNARAYFIQLAGDLVWNAEHLLIGATRNWAEASPFGI